MTTYLEQEIMSQPDVLARLFERELPRVPRLLADLAPFSYVIIAGRGTSDHAALYAKYIWAALAGYPVVLATPSLYSLYHTPPRMEQALVLGISQSGQSPDILAVLEEARRQGRPTLAITNDGSSPLAATADQVIELHAGAERSVAATKTYTAEVAALAMLAAAWSGRQEHMAELHQLPEHVARTLSSSAQLAHSAARYRYMERCVILGRGYNYATVFELALKLKELTYIMANAYSSADFRHGPIATIHAGMPAMLIMPDSVVFDDMLSLARDLYERGAELLIATNRPEAEELATTLLPLSSGVPEWLSPVPAIVPGQLLALHVAHSKGIDPDHPRGLQKVTRTI